jgi:hypothetical protein
MGGMASDQMPGKKDMQMEGMSHPHMDQPLNNHLAGINLFPQSGPRTTRLMPPPSKRGPLHVGPEVVGVAMKTSPRLNDPPAAAVF